MKIYVNVDPLCIRYHVAQLTELSFEEGMLLCTLICQALQKFLLFYLDLVAELYYIGDFSLHRH